MSVGVDYDDSDAAPVSATTAPIVTDRRFSFVLVVNVDLRTRCFEETSSDDAAAGPVSATTAPIVTDRCFSYVL